MGSESCCCYVRARHRESEARTYVLEIEGMLHRPSVLISVAVKAAGRMPALFAQHRCAPRKSDGIGGKRGVERALRRCIAVLACYLLSMLRLLNRQAVLTVSALIAR